LPKKKVDGSLSKGGKLERLAPGGAKYPRRRVKAANGINTSQEREKKLWEKEEFPRRKYLKKQTRSSNKNPHPEGDALRSSAKELKRHQGRRDVHEKGKTSGEKRSFRQKIRIQGGKLEGGSRGCRRRKKLTTLNTLQSQKSKFRNWKGQKKSVAARLNSLLQGKVAAWSGVE